jgi:hypothetical protein
MSVVGSSPRSATARMAHSVCAIACGASSGLVTRAMVASSSSVAIRRIVVSAVRVDYWTTFARRGSAWRSGTVQRLAPSPGGSDFAREHQIAFWRSLTG